MMKSLLVSLLALTGCVTSGLQSLETKYVLGDCTVATPEYMAQQPALKNVETLVYALTLKGYHVVYVLPLVGVLDQGEVDREIFDANTVKSECSETSKKLLPETKKEPN